jgi:hypothetical protein
LTSYPPGMGAGDDDERARKRQETREGLNWLRSDPATSERLRVVLELLAERLDRLETGTFSPEEVPTQPDPARVRKSSGSMPAFRAERVTAILEEGKGPPKKDEG